MRIEPFPFSVPHLLGSSKSSSSKFLENTEKPPTPEPIKNDFPTVNISAPDPLIYSKPKSSQ